MKKEIVQHILPLWNTKLYHKNSWKESENLLYSMQKKKMVTSDKCAPVEKLNILP